MREEEICSECGQATGKAGKTEDSLYIAPDGYPEIGPLCEECYDRIAWGGNSLWQPIA